MIHIGYTSVLKCCYNDIWLWFLLCFGAETEIMYALLVYIWQQHSKSQNLTLPISSKNWMAEQYQGSSNCEELDLKSDANRTDSGKLWQSTTVSSQCDRFS